MYENEKPRERAVLVGVHASSRGRPENATEESMKELAELARTAGAEAAASMIQNRERPDGATYVGEGKLEELKAACEDLGADLVLFDDELSGSQLRNIERALGVRVVDRSCLILDIFAQRALSSEGKIQVELAQLKYNLPRLIGRGTELSRLGGGIGTRGPGETKLESDRRHIRRRIAALEEELREIELRRDVLRRKRKKEEFVTAALVGYTNSGKSTLMNALTGADVFTQDLLFATLDATARRLDLPDGRGAVLIDTVGFIRKLPHHLVEAFKSTLEEAVSADVLVHVIDSSSPEMPNMIRVVDALLESLGCSASATVAVFNKCDAAPPLSPRPPGRYDDFISVSAKTGENLPRLIDLLDKYLPGKKREMRLLIPYSNSRAAAVLHDGEIILEKEYRENGTYIRLLADGALYAQMEKYLV